MIKRKEHLQIDIITAVMKINDKGISTVSRGKVILLFLKSGRVILNNSLCKFEINSEVVYLPENHL